MSNTGHVENSNDVPCLGNKNTIDIRCPFVATLAYLRKKKMGKSEISTWVLIRRYDQLENEAAELQSILHCLTLKPGSISEDLRVNIFQLIDVEDDGSRVVKIRRPDNSLVPMSTLLNGSDKDKPFIIDIVKVHQFCPVERRTILPAYIDALKTKFCNLENRVIRVERSLPEMTTCHIRAVEDAALQLANCLSFLDRRVEELAPSDWHAQICSGI